MSGAGEGVPSHVAWELLTAAAQGVESTKLADALRQLADGGMVDSGLISDSEALRRLNRLRHQFVKQLATSDPAPDLSEVATILTAMERLSDSLEPANESRLSHHLLGPNGLDLVVEVAHDLRSPLTSILFLAETLLRGRSGPISPLQERQLGLIYSAAFGLSAVTSDMVELARGRDRLIDPEPMPFSVRDILESVRDIVRPIAEEKGLEIRLVAPQRPYRVGVPVAINRILLNLVTNALKFTEEGYVELAAVEGPGSMVEFTVRDTGRGIPPQAMALLFEPFRRRQRGNDYAFSGSGLGLSICRKLVESIGSELQVETELGRGTRFTFGLPLPEPTLGAPLRTDTAMAV